MGKFTIWGFQGIFNTDFWEFKSPIFGDSRNSLMLVTDFYFNENIHHSGIFGQLKTTNFGGLISRFWNWFQRATTEHSDAIRSLRLILTQSLRLGLFNFSYFWGISITGFEGSLLPILKVITWRHFFEFKLLRICWLFWLPVFGSFNNRFSVILITDLFTSETDQIILPSDCLQVTDLISNTCSNYGDSDRIPNSGGFNHRFLKLRKNTEHFILNINELKN